MGAGSGNKATKWMEGRSGLRYDSVLPGNPFAGMAGMGAQFQALGNAPGALYSRQKRDPRMRGMAQGAATGAVMGGMYGGPVGAVVGAAGGGAYGTVSADQAEQKKFGGRSEAELAGAQARQGAMAGGLSGGGIQSQMDVEAYGQVMQNYAQQSYQEQQMQQARQAQALQLVMMLYGFNQGGAAGGGVAAYNASGGMYGSAGSYGPSEFGE